MDSTDRTGRAVTGRRAFLGIGASAVMAGSYAYGADVKTGAASRAPDPRGLKKPVKAFCIDFNWGPNAASTPGMYAQADPAEHFRWYRDLGANTIQTFCVSYNGYAWYPSGVAPVTPGLAHPDFLGEMVNLGHKSGMLVMGYFTLGANPWWEAGIPIWCTATMQNISRYMRWNISTFCRSVEDALLKTGGTVSVDWFLPCLAVARLRAGDVPPAMERVPSTAHLRNGARIRPTLVERAGIISPARSGRRPAVVGRTIPS